MAPMIAVLWIFVGLTVIFAGFTLWLLTRQARATQDEVISQQSQRMRNFSTRAAAATPDDLKTIADAIATVLDALGKFGAHLDKLRSTAIAGVFTALFAILSAAMAFAANSH